VTPRISVVVPTVDRVELLARTLRGLAAQDIDDFEVIVVHDGHVDIKTLLHQWKRRLPLQTIETFERGAVPKRNAGWRDVNPRRAGSKRRSRRSTMHRRRSTSCKAASTRTRRTRTSTGCSSGW
jgi:glycosyltransferase involved in cell wall biosynthesis